MRTFLHRHPELAFFLRGAAWVTIYAVALMFFVYVAVSLSRPKP